jgi:hypothetical protein
MADAQKKVHHAEGRKIEEMMNGLNVGNYAGAPGKMPESKTAAPVGCVAWADVITVAEARPLFRNSTDSQISAFLAGHFVSLGSVEEFRKAWRQKLAARGSR